MSKNGVTMTSGNEEVKTAIYLDASNLLEQLLSKDFEIIAEMFCEEIADELWNDFMKDRDEDTNCIVEDIENIKKLLVLHQSQLTKIALFLKNTHPIGKEDPKLNDLEKMITELVKSIME